MNEKIFREYDIRGIAENDLNDHSVMQISLAFGTLALRQNVKKIAIGRDCRSSSTRIFDTFINGIISLGIDVIDLGIITTPILYYSLFNLDIDGGVMITASHNPPDYNGFKAAIGTEVLSSNQIQELKNIILANDFHPKDKDGKLTKNNIIDRYTEDLIKNINIRKNIKVGVDCANTPVGLFARKVFESVGCETFPLFENPDGTFPNHHPDPSVEENLSSLKNLVISKKLDLGVSFDGDADRIGIIDDEGNLVYSDIVLAILAKSILLDLPNSKIIGEVKCSKVLFDEIRKNGGIPLMWKTGHSNIKRKIKEEKAPLAGELSGHIFFSDKHYGYDDAIYAALRFVEILSNYDDKLSVILDYIPKMFSTPEIRLDFPEDRKFQIVDDLAEELKKLKSEYSLINIDGIRIENLNSWGLVRASNTQPALSMRFESNSEESLEKIKNEVLNLLEKVSGIKCKF